MYRLPPNAINLGQPVNRSAPLNRGLVAWWLAIPQRMQGNRFLDLCGVSHGVLRSGPLWSSPLGRPGGLGSIFFDGVNDDILAPTISIAADISFSLWAKIVAYSGQGFFIQKGPVNSQWALYYDISFIRITGGSATTYSVAAPSNGVWHHFVGTISGTTGTIYIDGISAGSGTITAIANGSGSICIGSFDGGYYISGNLDDVRLYNRILSASEAWQLYNASRTGYRNELNRTRRPIAMEAAAAGAVGGSFYGAGQFSLGA